MECQFCLWKQAESNLYVTIHPATHLCGSDDTPICRFHSLDVLLSGRTIRKLDGSDPIRVGGSR